MSMVIVTAQVNDVVEWEGQFRTHGELFQRQTVTRVDLGVTEDDCVACAFHVEDLDAFFELMASPDTAEAMANDGVDKDSVKVFVMEGRFDP